MADYEIPGNLRYSRADEWIRIEASQATIGVTDFAQQELGDVTYVELPATGTIIEAGEPFGVIESVKTVADLYAPLSGEVIESNVDLTEHPEAVNESCYGDGWMLTIAIADPEEVDALLDANAYRKHVEERAD